MTWALARAPATIDTATSFSALDDMTQTVSGGADPLDGKALILPVGQVWDTSPATGTFDGTDYEVEDVEHTARRTEVSDASNAGRYGYAGTNQYVNGVFSVDFRRGPHTFDSGLTQRVIQRVFARSDDPNNWVSAQARHHTPGFGTTPSLYVDVQKRLAGTITLIKTIGPIAAIPENVMWTFQMLLDDDVIGVYSFAAGGSAGSPVWTGTDASLLSGALASGMAGIYDEKAGANACTRNYKNFYVAPVPVVPSAALHASRSMRFTHEAIYRDSADGTLEGRVPVPEGKYPPVPPATRAGRRSRLVVKARRFDLKSGLPDSGIADALTGDMTVTPRIVLLTGTDVTPGGFPVYLVTGDLTDFTYNANTATPQEIVNVLATAINAHAIGGVAGVVGFTATSYTPTFTLPADPTWEQIADVLGTVLNALQTTPGAAPAFSFPGLSINRNLNAVTISSLNVARVLGSWTTDLEENGDL